MPTHDRPLRLRWLLNALEEQTLPRDRWAVVVVHDGSSAVTRALLATHPVAARVVEVPRGQGTPARQRNAGWRAVLAPHVAFTDDDCRPDPRWLEELLAVARRAPGAIVQGTTRPDPFEEALLVAPRTRTLSVDPPSPYAPTANVLYPRAVLERVGGFDEAMPAAAGEDTDLAERARATGAADAAARDAVVYHAIEEYTLAGMARLSWKWQHLAYVVERHPRLRRHTTLGIFWRPSHALLLLAALGAAASGRRPALAVLTLPYLRAALLRHGRGPRAIARAAVELPGHTVVEAVEVAALARGSVRHRTLLL